LGHDFLVTEAEVGRVRAADSRNPQKQVWSGPPGKGWPRNWREYPQDLQEWAAREASRGGGKSPSKWSAGRAGRCPQLSADDARAVSVWRGYLVEIHDRRVRARNSPAPGFEAVEADPPKAAPPPEPLGPYPKSVRTK
jgi:hypothetical protein